MEHQDWTPVTVKKAPTKLSALKTGQYTVEQKINTGNKLKSDIHASKIEESDKPTFVLSTKEISVQMQDARREKQWTRVNLARACNLTENTIRDYETCKAIVKMPELEKISKALGIVIKKPKIKK